MTAHVRSLLCRISTVYNNPAQKKSGLSPRNHQARFAEDLRQKSDVGYAASQRVLNAFQPHHAVGL